MNLGNLSYSVVDRMLIMHVSSELALNFARTHKRREFYWGSLRDCFEDCQVTYFG